MSQGATPYLNVPYAAKMVGVKPRAMYTRLQKASVPHIIKRESGQTRKLIPTDHFYAYLLEYRKKLQDEMNLINSSINHVKGIITNVVR